MEQAGTSPDYRGLYASAREFVPPSAEELERAGEEFPERAKVPALVEMMVQVDERWDHLKAVQKAGFKAPPDQPGHRPAARGPPARRAIPGTREAPRDEGAGGGIPRRGESGRADTRRAWRLPCGRSARGRPRGPEGGRVGVPRGREELHDLPRRAPR